MPGLFGAIALIIKKFDNTGEDLEDLIPIGTIGLIKAIESFSPNKGTKLATFAARCIENEILMHLRSLKKTRKDVSLHDPIGTDKEGNEITLIDILGTEADDVVDKVQLKIEKSKIYKNLDILDEREKEVVVGRFGLELGGEELNREKGIFHPKNCCIDTSCCLADFQKKNKQLKRREALILRVFFLFMAESFIILLFGFSILTI